MITATMNRRLHFHGQGGKLFSVFLLNMILTVLTLGIYYPWAKVAIMKYMYEETEFEGSRFMFHGTGKELFMGFLKAALIFGVIYVPLFLLMVSDVGALANLALILVYLISIALVPFAIHGAVKYRMSRTSWRGIHFGYRGDRTELMRKFYLDAVLTLITFGIYAAWMTVNIRRYVVSNIRFGNVEFSYAADGGNFLALHLKGYCLTIITFGIYGFWYAKDLFNFWVNHTSLMQNGHQARLRSNATGGDMFALLVPNVLLVVFTLGLGTPWAMIRSMNFALDHIMIEGELDTDHILQTESSYKDATGVEVADMLDLDLM